MTIEALLTNTAFGYPTRGHVRRHTPHILAVVHQTATMPYNGQAMALRNQRNGAGFSGNTATYYVDPDGSAVHAVDGTRFVSWCSAPEKISYVDPTRPSMATVKQHFALGFNPNECVWEQFECVGTGAEPWTAAQFEFVAGIIAARAKLSGLPINRDTVVPHRDMNTVNRPSDPWPGSIREARMARLIASAKALAGSTTPPETSTGGTDVSIATVKLTSDHVATFTAATPYLDAPAGASIGAGSKIGYVEPYIGIAAGFAAVLVTTALPYPDKVARPTVVYVPRAAVTVAAVPAVAGPPSQADITKAVAADRLKAHITWQA